MHAKFGRGPMVVSKRGDTDRQTYEQTDRQTDRKTDRQTYKHTQRDTAALYSRWTSDCHVYMRPVESGIMFTPLDMHINTDHLPA